VFSGLSVRCQRCFHRRKRACATEFEVAPGDIAAQSADVPVDATGVSRQVDSGITGALGRGASEELGRGAVETGSGFSRGH
jgi:hypothetical protein